MTLNTIRPFNRNFYDTAQRISFIGGGLLGGKAAGLQFITEIIQNKLDHDRFPGIKVSIPRFTVIRTDVFDRFMQSNKLYDVVRSGLADDRIAHAFQQAKLSFEILGDLRSLVENVRTPLAVRSSGMLEDALDAPFAGVYATKMTPNNQHDADSRFYKLIEAIKFIYASTFFHDAQNYMQATRHRIEDEKMAVIIQEVVGRRYRDRFYPVLSIVARTYNYYAMGRARPEDGVVNLAFGLGKTIVDGGISWSYSPRYPQIGPPFANVNEMLKQTQTEFWAINMGKPAVYNPLRETEYMTRSNIIAASEDETLHYVASTLDRYSGRLSIGTGINGPRVLNFAPLLALDDVPLNELIKSLLKICEDTYQAAVEIECAMTLTADKTQKHQLGFLQVRPMMVPHEAVEIDEKELNSDSILISTKNALGNGVIDTIKDVVFLHPQAFDVKFTQQIATELETFNKQLLSVGRPYLLIGFGRWGSSDPWLGIPVNWGQISGAKIIVEAAIKNMNVELSQGAHFFHNLCGFNVFYLSIPYAQSDSINWDWLLQQQVVTKTQFLYHIRLKKSLFIKVDGRSGRGVILKTKAG